AAVVAQIQHYAIDFLLLQIAEQTTHVTGGAAVIRIATAIGLEVDIETGYFDDADTEVIALLIEFQHRRLGGLIFEFYCLTDQGDFTAGHVARRIAGRNDFQAYW